MVVVPEAIICVAFNFIPVKFPAAVVVLMTARTTHRFDPLPALSKVTSGVSRIALCQYVEEIVEAEKYWIETSDSSKSGVLP